MPNPDPQDYLNVADAVASVEAARKFLERKIAERKQLDEEIAEIRRALGGPNRAAGVKCGRGLAKDTLLTLLSERKAYGINAAIAVELAAERGEVLRRSTMSSLLSRLKNDGVVRYDGHSYRLAEYAP